MELYAAGFNAWKQLDFDKHKIPDDLPSDLDEFTKVFADDRIERVSATISATTVNSSSGVHTAGHPEDFYGTRFGFHPRTSLAAVTGAGILATYNEDTGAITQYSDACCYKGESKGIFSGVGRIIQIVGYETGFAALSAKGEVWTWGSERYSACLGRVVTGDRPADSPGLVTDLMELPTGKITKIAASGYLLMALTEYNDLYAWGGGQSGLPAVIEDISQTPEPVVVEENDIADFAVGEHHATILTTEGEIFVVGDNTNGQLGLPGVKKVGSWTRVPLALEAGRAISGVACGPRNTYIVVCRNTNSA